MKINPLLSLIIILISISSSSCSDNNSASGEKSGNAISVEVFITGVGTVDNIIHAPGSILPNEQVIIKTEIPGRVVKLNFKEGQWVARGALLVQIDDSEYKAELKKYEAQLQLATDDESRKKELLSMRGVSQEVYDVSLSKREELLANIDLINTRIRKSRITAPFDGKIGLRHISEGAYVSNGDVIATFVQINPVRIEFNVAEKYAPLIHNDMNIQFNVAGQQDTFSSSVYAIEPMIDPGSRMLRVRSRSDNSSGLLIPGSFADLTIKLEEIKDAVMVPTQVIVPALNTKNIFIVKNGHVELRSIETGIQTNNMVQITEGIEAGDSVIMTGILALKDKMPVQISKVHRENN